VVKSSELLKYSEKCLPEVGWKLFPRHLPFSFSANFQQFPKIQLSLKNIG
jgi:hypothetical protein